MNAAPANLQHHAGACAPQQINQRRQRRLVEPDIAIEHLAMQKLDGCGGGVSLLHPHDPAVTQPRRKQSKKQEREHRLVASYCARNHLLNITGDWRLAIWGWTYRRTIVARDSISSYGSGSRNTAGRGCRTGSTRGAFW